MVGIYKVMYHSILYNSITLIINYEGKKLMNLDSDIGIGVWYIFKNLCYYLIL